MEDIDMSLRNKNDHAAGDAEMALAAVIGSGVLNANELELLALVSKHLQSEASNDGVWKSLCETVVRPNCLPESIVNRTGYRWLYWQWIAPTMARAPRVDYLPPPSCKAEDLVLIVNILYPYLGFHQTFVMEGDKLKTLLDEGRVEISLNQTLNVVDHTKFGIAIRLFRYSDMAMCSIAKQFARVGAGYPFNCYNAYEDYFIFRPSDLTGEIHRRLSGSRVFFRVDFNKQTKEMPFLGSIVITTSVDVDPEDADGDLKVYDPDEFGGLTLLHLLSELQPNEIPIPQRVQAEKNL